jgi:hypothetical protein
MAYSDTSWPCWAKSNADARPPFPAPRTATRTRDLLDLTATLLLALDGLHGELGHDRRGGDDTIAARDDTADAIVCGAGVGTAQRR